MSEETIKIVGVALFFVINVGVYLWMCNNKNQ